MSGALGLIGEPPGRPSIPLNLVADNGGAAMHAALGIMFALFARERSGRGQHVDVSYLDTTIALLAASPNLRRYFSSGVAPQRGEGVFSGGYPYYSIYDTRDGGQLTVACSEPWLWENFYKAIGRPDFVQHGRQPEHYRRAPNAQETAVRTEVQTILRARDRDDWNELLIAADACVGKVYGIDEMVCDPQVLHRRMVVDIEHSEWGPVRQFGTAIKFSESRAEARSMAPAPGEHTTSRKFFSTIWRRGRHFRLTATAWNRIMSRPTCGRWARIIRCSGARMRRVKRGSVASSCRRPRF